MEPIVSIIVPCYNYGHFLAETLISIQQQSLQEWECIIIDDGSSDNSEHVAKQFIDKDKRFIYVFQENQGLSAARNTGIKKSRGKFIQLLDADDLIEKDKLKIQSDLLKTKNDNNIVISNASFFLDSFSEKKLISWYKSNKLEIKNNDSIIFKKILERNVLPVNAPLLPKNVFSKIGYFDINLKSVEDWDFWLRCIQSGYVMEFRFIAGTSAYIRKHGGSMLTNTWKMEYNKILVRKKLYSNLNSKQKLLNKFYINSSKKTLLYYIASIQDLDLRNSKIVILHHCLHDFRLVLFKYLAMIIPYKYLPKLVLVIFENPLNIISQKVLSGSNIH